jgi:FdhE protein
MNRLYSDRLEQLTGMHPEWQPWLEVLGHSLREAGNPAWRSWVPAPVARTDDAAPLLAHAVIRVDPEPTRRWVHELFTAAARAGYATARRIADEGPERGEALAILESAACLDASRFEKLAGDSSAQGFRAIAEVAALPLLQACGERWAAAVPASWRHGYCPVCGAWPALAEARGIDRSRWLRCVRCGSDWAAAESLCVFCGTRDQEQLGLLGDDAGAGRRQVETCSACRSYVKTIATLEGSPRTEVVLDDLASVDLDLAALSEGYSRPARRPCAISARVVERRRGLGGRLLHLFS